MKFSNFCKTLLVIACIGVSAVASAEPNPKWISEKEIAKLNDQRINDTYSFHLFHLESADNQVLVLDRFRPLKEYVAEVYGVERRRIAIDSITPGANGRTTYTLSFRQDGEPKTVYAQRVDEFTRLDDYVDNHYEFNYYQLFAVTEPGVETPMFDDFAVTRKFNVAAATFASIIPGVGQMYKGQYVKGGIILGTEVVLMGALIWSNERYNHFKQKEKDENRNYHNKKTTFKQLRAFSAIAGAGLFVYNIFDAALYPVKRHVVISKPNGYDTSFSFSPVATPDPINGGFNIGLGLTYNF